MSRIGDARKWLTALFWGADLIVLVAAGLVAGGVWAFLVIADVVSEGGHGQTDARILRAMRETDDVRKP
ncbi:MAG: hypothetical protein K8U57_07830, partial [Planctomycetes bacterium]|nr:hypothetical protein [Planctomycetota bacterium]